MKPEPPIIRASDVKSRSLRWAWTGRLIIGYLVVLTGIEGLGKSVLGFMPPRGVAPEGRPGG